MLKTTSFARKQKIALNIRTKVIEIIQENEKYVSELSIFKKVAFGIQYANNKNKLDSLIYAISTQLYEQIREIFQEDDYLEEKEASILDYLNKVRERLRIKRRDDTFLSFGEEERKIITETIKKIEEKDCNLSGKDVFNYMARTHEKAAYVFQYLDGEEFFLAILEANETIKKIEEKNDLNSLVNAIDEEEIYFTPNNSFDGYSESGEDNKTKKIPFISPESLDVRENKSSFSLFVTILTFIIVVLFIGFFVCSSKKKNKD